MLTERQKAIKLRTVSASEIYDVLVHPYRVWRRKQGKDSFDDQQDFIRLGNRFEAPVARTYERETGKRLIPSADTIDGRLEPVSLIHPCGWASMTPDGIPVSSDSPVMAVPTLEGLWTLRDSGQVDHVYEGKTSSEGGEMSAQELDGWSDGEEDWHRPVQPVRMPLRYAAQLQWSMGLAGLPWMALRRLRFVNEPVRRALAAIDAVQGLEPAADAVLAALLEAGAAELHTYRVEADAELFGLLWQAGERFYCDSIRDGKPPPPSCLEDLEQEVSRQNPTIEGTEPEEATEEQERLLEAYQNAYIEAKGAGHRLDFLKALVEDAIGNAPGLVSSVGKVSLSRVPGWRSVDAGEALGAFLEALQTDPRVGKLPPEAVSLARVVAMEKATKQGEPYAKLNAPRRWTKGLEEDTFRSMAERWNVKTHNVKG